MSALTTAKNSAEIKKKKPQINISHEHRHKNLQETIKYYQIESSNIYKKNNKCDHVRAISETQA